MFRTKIVPHKISYKMVYLDLRIGKMLSSQERAAKLRLISKNGYDLSQTPFLDSARPPEYEKNLKIFFPEHFSH